jgi:hypothetical protein
MQNLHILVGAHFYCRSWFQYFAILLQSGIDKVVDRRGNLEWLSILPSPLVGIVPLMILAITTPELALSFVRD